MMLEISKFIRNSLEEKSKLEARGLGTAVLLIIGMPLLSKNARIY